MSSRNKACWTVPMCVHVRLCVYNDVYVPFTRLCWFTLEDYKRFHICFISMSFISFHLLIRLPLRSPSLFLVLVAHICCCLLFGILCVHNIDYFSFGCCFQLWTVHSELLKFYFFKYFYFEIYRESILFCSLIDVSRFILNSSIFMHILRYLNSVPNSLNGRNLCNFVSQKAIIHFFIYTNSSSWSSTTHFIRMCVLSWYFFSD